MEDTFQIIEVGQGPVGGDYLTFVIDDSGKPVPGRLSNTAIAELKKGREMSDLAVFQENAEKLRQAAFRKRRVNPSLDLIILGTYDL